MKHLKLIGVLITFVCLAFLASCSSSEQSTSSSQLGGSIQGKSLSINGNVTTFAGISGAADGIGTAASFKYPYSITSDGTNLYVVDYGNNVIRKIVISTGVVTTLAGAAGMPGSTDGIGAAASFNGPTGITTDGTNLYVTEVIGNTVRKIVIQTGEVTTLAGTAGIPGSSDGTGTSASFYGPYGIATDGTNLYVSDIGNKTIRKIVINTGEVTTIAGTAGVYGSADGNGIAASFSGPKGITIAGTNLYVADGDNVIRKITISSGEVTTFAGTAGVYGSADGIGAAASFFGTQDIATDGINLFVTDLVNQTIRKITISTGAVTTLAGTPGAWGSTDGIGPAASFNNPAGITINGNSLYVTDSTNNIIRKINMPGAEVSTLAGIKPFVGVSDAIGTKASFNGPWGITTDGTNLYVADSYNYTIRKVVISTGEVTTLAGTAGFSGFMVDGVGTNARFISPLGITTDGANLYVTDYGTIRKIVISSGAVTTIAGSSVLDFADGAGSSASFRSRMGITTDGTYLYVADSENSAIRKVAISNGMVTTLAGVAGNIGCIDGIGTAARFNSPEGITTDGKFLYVADLDNTIRKVDISTGAVTTLNGSAIRMTDINGLPIGNRGISTDGTNLFVTNDATNTIKKIVIATGNVSTLAGSAGKWGSADGAGLTTRFGIPVGITTDGTSLFVADFLYNAIRKIN